MKSNKQKTSKKSPVVKEFAKKTRISAEELFSLFTADIINKKATFTR